MKLKTTLYTSPVMVVSRFLFLLLFSLSFLLPHQNVAQETYLNKKIHLKQGAIRLDSAMLSIKKQAGIVFSFNPRKLDPKQKIFIKSNIKTLSGFIEVLKKETNVPVKLIEDYVVIGSYKSSQADEPIVTVTQKKIIEKEIQLKKEEAAKDSINLIAVAKIDSVIVTTPKSAIDSMMTKEVSDSSTQISPTILAQIPSSITPSDSTKSVVTAPSLPKPDTTKVIPPKPKKRKTNNQQLFVKPGITGDESSFMGLMVQAGWPIFYGTLSVHTNLKASHIRYGGGTSFKLNTNLRLHIVANNGTVNREGHFTDVYGDRHPIAVESNLFRAGAGLEFRLKSKLSVQVMPVFNQLTTEYFINNAPSNLEVFKNKGDEIFYAIKSPYTISDTFSPTKNSSTKTWVGLQLNLLYRINFGKGNRGNP